MMASTSHPACVAMVSPTWPPTGAPNGIVVYTGAIKPALESAGVRVVVMAGGEGPDQPDAIFPLRQPGFFGKYLRNAGLTLRGHEHLVSRLLTAGAQRAIKQWGAELIEMEESFGWCEMVARQSGVPVVGRLHGPWFLNGPALGIPQDAAYHDRLEREGRGILACQGITSPSQDVLDRTRAYYGIELPEARVIHYPIELMPEAVRWRPELSEPETILFVGRFDRHKGGDTMLDAFGRIAARRPRARLTFIGPDRGLMADDGRRWTLPEYLERLPPGARERVACPGYRPVSEIPALRARAAVTVICSRYETSGYTVLEGMAGSCPMVVTRCGGPTELVQHERTALMCEPDDPAGLAEQIERMLEGRPLAARLAAAAIRDAEARFNPRSIAAETVAYYRRILGSAEATGV